MLLAAWAGAKIERVIRNVIPDELDMILTSMLTLIFTAVLTYIVIMPIGVWLFQGMSGCLYTLTVIRWAALYWQAFS